MDVIIKYSNLKWIGHQRVKKYVFTAWKKKTIKYLIRNLLNQDEAFSGSSSSGLPSHSVY